MHHSNSKKQRLLAAAHTLFLSNGYNGVKVDTICTTAHTAKGTFFYYFPTKQTIVLELLDKQLHDLSLVLYNELLALPDTSFFRLNHFINYLLSPLALTPECVQYFNLYHLPSWFESELEHRCQKHFYPIFYELLQSNNQIKALTHPQDKIASEVLYIGIQRYLHNHRNRLNDVIILKPITNTIQELLEKTLCLPSDSFSIPVP